MHEQEYDDEEGEEEEEDDDFDSSFDVRRYVDTDM